jgi:hypothetical protein
MLISNTLCDVIEIGSDTAPILLENEALVPVPPGTFDEADHMPLTLSMSRYLDGRLAGIPHDSGLRPFIYFDSADMREAGTTPAEAPEGYAAYRQWASKFFKWEVDGKTVLGALPEADLARASLKRRPLGITRGHVLSACPFMLAYIDPRPDADGKSDGSLDDFVGGPPSSETFRFDTPEFARGLAEWRDFYYPKQTAICDGDSERLNALQSDVYAGCEAGNWIYGEVFTVDMLVTALPHADGKPLRLSVTTSTFGVTKAAKNRDLAFAWAKYACAPNQQVDAYYGHGYLPSSYTAWKTLDADDKEDGRIREALLDPYREGNDQFIGEPQIRRTSHDSMRVSVFIPFGKDLPIVSANSWEEQAVIEAPPVEEGADAAEQAAAQQTLLALGSRYCGVMKALADEVAAMTGERVTVVLRGTPPEMVAIRSTIPTSPVPVYLPLLETGAYPPNMTIWNRISTEVITRAIQFVSSDTDPMTPEEAAKWCQEEATAIFQGKK